MSGHPEFGTQSWKEYASKCWIHGQKLPLGCPACGGEYGLEVTFKLDPPKDPEHPTRQPIVGIGCCEDCAQVNAVQRKLERSERKRKRAAAFKRAVVIESGATT